jgi:hypothetical protein
MKKLLSIEVRGNTNEWSFNFYGDPKYLEEWREDGLEINEIVNTIPEWVVDMGLTRLWIFFQDLFNFNFRQ